VWTWGLGGCFFFLGGEGGLSWRLGAWSVEVRINVNMSICQYVSMSVPLSSNYMCQFEPIRNQPPLIVSDQPSRKSINSYF